MNKVIAVAMVKNESDVIESFVRYNLRFVDELHIIEHKSDDNTPLILSLLQKEGLPVYVYDADDFAYSQSEMTTKLMHHCLHNDSSIDYCMPLDADEFIQCQDRASFRANLAEIPSGYAGLIFWKNYLPSTFEINPQFLSDFTDVKRMAELTLKNAKVILSRECGLRGILLQGNHLVFDAHNNMAPCDYVAFTPAEYERFKIDLVDELNLYFHNTEMTLAHYPVRSHPQLLSKILAGAITMEINNRRDDGSDYHWQNRAGFYFMRDHYTLAHLRKDAYEYPHVDHSNAAPESVELQIVERKALIEQPIQLKYQSYINVDPLLALYKTGLKTVDYYATGQHLKPTTFKAPKFKR